MEHFKIASANRHQLDHQNTIALSAVNAIALAQDLPWEEAYRLLLNQGHRYGLLLNDQRCLNNMLAEAGYVRARSFRALKSYDELCACMLARYPHVTHALAMTTRGGAGSNRVCALRRAEAPEEGFVAMDTRSEARGVLSLWLPYDQISAEKPVPLPAGSYHTDQSRPYPDHECYRYFQPNPRNNNIGDCVIRAYSAVFDVPWDDALDMVAKACEYVTSTLNSRETYRYLAAEYHLEGHEPLTRRGRMLTGREFCAEMTAVCHHGERFFALNGQHHVVGVVPVETGDGVKYVIKDSWDSTDRKMGLYFIYRPAPKIVEAPAAGEPPRVAPGEQLIHPRFGAGVVETVDPEKRRAVVQFPAAGQKTFPIAWLTANCRAG